MEPIVTEQQPRRITRIVALVALIVMIIGGLVGGVLLTRSEADNQASVASVRAAEVTVRADGTFSPDTIRIKKGQAVTWLSPDDGSRYRIAQISGMSGSDGLTAQEERNPGESYTYVFENTGTFTYYDALGSGSVTGTVIVTE